MTCTCELRVGLIELVDYASAIGAAILVVSKAPRMAFCQSFFFIVRPSFGLGYY